MPRLSAKQLIARDAKRDIKSETLAAVRRMRAGRKPGNVVHHFEVSDVTAARAQVGLSQEKFARVLGVSRRTLEGWEQGRRKPTGAARSLLMIARKHPDILRDMFNDHQ